MKRAIAREELALLESMKGTLFTEVLFRAAAAEALLGAGHRVEGWRVLAGARQHIQFRADRLGDPELRLAFLKQRHENRWVDELERRSPAP